jgi:hypothetical protein
MSDPDSASTPVPGETFEQFRRSFSYGSRGDLNFKFLKSLPDAESAEFLRRFLDDLGDAYDSGDVMPMIDRAIEAQVAGYAPKPGAEPSPHTYAEGPFTPMGTPMTAARVGLMNSGGHFAEGDDPRPFGIDGMTQEEAIDRIDDFLKDTPILSEIPADLPRDRMATRHGGYDITSAVIDRNVCFPMERLAEAHADGAVGGLTSTYFSFPGATAQGRLRRELPGWIERLGAEEPDVLLLVPV